MCVYLSVLLYVFERKEKALTTTIITEKKKKKGVKLLQSNLSKLKTNVFVDAKNDIIIDTFYNTFKWCGDRIKEICG